MNVKGTVQDNASVKGINLDVQSYADAQEVATIELIFNDFYSMFSFPNNERSWIFSLKNQPITLYRIYLAFKIFSFNLPAKQRVKI